NLNFNNLINTFETGYLMYTVTSNDGGCNVAKTSIPYVITEPSTRLICSNTILTGDVHTYTITIEYVKYDSSGNELNHTPDMNKTFSGFIELGESKNTLYRKIITDNTPQSDYEIDFSKTSEEDGTSGLYYTTDLTKTENGKHVFYYRGAVTNNYVVFGSYEEDLTEIRGYHSSIMGSYKGYNSLAECNNASSYNNDCEEVTLASAGSAMCWRIVRTVEDGSVRLRYGGAATQNGETYTCPQTGTAINIATGQTYYTSYNNKSYVNYKTSSIRTTVENWYRDNIWKNGQNTKVTNLVADTPYCNDMSEPTTTNKFGAYDRLYPDGSNTYNPQYKCPSSTYAYTVAKGDITYPIALLTADEVVYAGGTTITGNSSYYLYTGDFYWTMSPRDFSASYALVFTVNSGGALGGYRVSGTRAAVPVVSLKNDAEVEKGTGAYNNPYIIKTN
ncbi:MAG: hypothetical protein IJB82_00610, partial [Bacilli bacterium]|nr:hypothetical protein [Bacilli bacterium]